MMTPRRIPRSLYEEARDVARALAKTKAFEQSRRDSKRVEMLFAHLKRILRLGHLRLRGPRGAQFEFTLAAIAQNLRRLAKLVARPPPIALTACPRKVRSVLLEFKIISLGVDAAPTGARREIVLGVTFKIRLSDPRQTPMRLSQQNRPFASLSATQRYVRSWGISRHRADIVDPALLTPSVMSAPFGCDARHRPPSKMC
jgi:hypothetical protein